METVSSAVGGVLSGVSTFIVFLGVFLPEIAILAGFVSDLLNLHVRHIPTSTFGILAAILNWLVAWIFSFLGGPAPAVSTFGSAWNWASANISGSGSGSGAGAAAGGLGAQAAAISNMLSGRVTPVGVGSPVPLPRPGARNVVQQAVATAAEAAAPVIAAAAPAVPQPLAGVTSTPDGTTPSGSGSGGPVFNVNITGAPAAPTEAPRASGYPASGLFGNNNPSAFNLDASAVQSQVNRANAARANATAARTGNLLRTRGFGTGLDGSVSVAPSRAPSVARSVRGGGRKEQTGGASLAEFVDDKFNPCAVRGLGFFNVSTRPMGIAVLTTIFFVYLLDMSVNKKRTGSEQTAYWLVAMGILGLNTYSYYRLGCIDSFFSVFTPLCVGLFVGGIAFWIYQSAGKNYLPMDPESGPPTGEHSKCASTDGGGDFVCDAYLNGERIGTVAT